jgi:hypothetical protein
VPPPLPRASLTVAEHPIKERPQPIDYGLTYDDVNLYNHWEWCRLDGGKVIQCIGTRPDDRYREGRQWFGVLRLPPSVSYTVGGFAFWQLLFGILAVRGPGGAAVGLGPLGIGLARLVCSILPGILMMGKELFKAATLTNIPRP